MSAPAKTINVTEAAEYERVYQGVAALANLGKIFEDYSDEQLKVAYDEVTKLPRKEGPYSVLLMLPEQFQAMHFMLRYLRDCAVRLEEDMEAFEVLGRQFERRS